MSGFEAQPAHHHPVQNHTSVFPALFASSCRTTVKWKSTHAVDEEQVCSTRPCGQATVRVDNGYTEAYTDSEEERHGQGLLRDQQSAESDNRKSRDGSGPASVDGSLCNCTMVAIGEGQA